MQSEKPLDKVPTKTLKTPKPITMRTNLSNGPENDPESLKLAVYTEEKIFQTKWPDRGGLSIFFGTNV